MGWSAKKATQKILQQNSPRWWGGDLPEVEFWEDHPRTRKNVNPPSRVVGPRNQMAQLHGFKKKKT